MLLQAVSPVSDQIVWASGHGGTFVRTTDGGETWTARVMPGQETLQFRDVDAFSARTAYLMSAGAGTVSRIYRTDDGGETWDLQFQNEHPDGFFDCMAFWDVDHGILYCDEIEGQLYILRTDDGGASWNRVPASALPPAQDGEGGFAASGSCVATAEGGRGWIATGAAERARVLVTEDWGRTWTDSQVPVPGGAAAGLTTIGFLDNETGVALGGVIGQDTLRVDNVTITSDGGRTWTSGGRSRLAGPVYGSHDLRCGSWRRRLLGRRWAELASGGHTHLLGRLLCVGGSRVGRGPAGTDHTFRFQGRLTGPFVHGLRAFSGSAGELLVRAVDTGRSVQDGSALA